MRRISPEVTSRYFPLHGDEYPQSIRPYREVTDGAIQLGRFSIYQKGAPPPFEMTAAFNSYKENHCDDPDALALAVNGGIGNPIQTPQALERRKRVLDGKESPSQMTDGAHKIYEVISGWIDTTLVEHSSRYSRQGGDLEAFDEVFTSLGNGLIDDKRQMTIVTGGLSRARARIAEFVQQSSFRTVIPLSSHIADPQKKAEYLETAISLIEKNPADVNFRLTLDYEKDSQVISDDHRRRLQKIAESGKLIIVNLVNQGIVGNSIALDEVLGKYVITVDASPLSEVTGVVGIMGAKSAVNWIADRATSLHGTPSTSEQDFRVLLSRICRDADALQNLLSLSQDDVMSLPTNFMQKAAKLLQTAAQYVTNPGQNEDYRTTFRKIVNSAAEELERELIAFNALHFDKNPYPSDDIAVTNGGAREGIVTALEDLRENKGITTVVIPTADWPYKDLDIPGLDILYIEDAFSPAGFDKDKVLDALSKLNARGVKYALGGLPSGPHNPTGIIIEKGVMSEILTEVSKNKNAWVVADDTYLHETFDEKDEFTVSQVGHGLNFHRIVSVAADTKDWGLPGNRKVSILSRDYEVIDRIRSKRITHNIDLNAVAVLYQQALVENPNEAKAIMKLIRDEAKKRYDLWVKVLDEEGIPHTRAQGGLYICFPNPALLDCDPHAKALEIAKNHGVSFLTVYHDMDGGEAWSSDKGVWSRIAYAGMREEPWEDYEKRVRNAFKVLRKVTEEDGRTWPFHPPTQVTT